MIEPPDRANELAKEALAEINRIGAMFAGIGDPTACQVLAISHAMRKYFVEETEKWWNQTGTKINAVLAGKKA